MTEVAMGRDEAVEAAGDAAMENKTYFGISGAKYEAKVFSAAAFHRALRERGFAVARAEPDENMLWTGGRIILDAVGAKPAELAATVYRAMLEAAR